MATSPRSLIERWGRTRLGRNTVAMFMGQAGKVVLQGAYFVVVARALGVSGFGAFAGVVALVALVTPFAALGAQSLLVRSVVAEPDAVGRHVRTYVAVSTLGGLVMTVLLIAVAPWVAADAVTRPEVAMIAVADLLAARLVDVAGAVYTATERMLRTAAFQLWFNAARLAGALALWLSPLAFTLETWALVYLVTSVVPAWVILDLVRRRVGPVPWSLRQFRREWRDGVLFSFSLSAQSVSNDIDKAMLARLSTLDATGIYTAAYRVIDIAFTPMRALLAAAYPRFFRRGSEGLPSALEVARRIARPGVSYCAGAGVLLLATADLIPVILGSDYAPAVDAIRAMALLPLLKSIHYLAADSLTGARHQGLRTVAQVVVAATNVGLNLVLIPMHGYWGAVIASLVCDGLLGVLLWGAVLVRLRSAHSR